MKRAAALLMMVAFILSMSHCVHAFAAALTDDDFFLPGSAASDSDAGINDGVDENGRQLADFEHVPMVPLNEEIPEFYQEVVNISGMYVFTLPDGTVYKRIYGAVNGSFGWYEPSGPKNLIFANAEPVNIEDDKKLYYAAVDAADASASSGLYPGILPPESGVNRITSAFGMTVIDFFAVFGGAAALLCLIILVGAGIRRKRKKRQQQD